MRILIVDDHPMFRKGVKNVIEDNIKDCLIFEADCITGAEKILKKEKIDIVTLDINLGEESGLNFISQIKIKFPNSKIVMLTMYDIEEIFNEAVDAGIDGYLLKDSPEEEIILALKNIYSGKSYISSSVIDQIIKRTNSNREFNLDLLTPTEKKILKLVSEFKSSKEIAELMHVHYRTIENHRTNINRKLNLTGKNSLIQFAVSNKEHL